MNFLASMYQRLENNPTPAPHNLTVGNLETWEAHGEPWPISGDLTTLERLHAEHVHITPGELEWGTK